MCVEDYVKEFQILLMRCELQVPQEKKLLQDD